MKNYEDPKLKDMEPLVDVDPDLEEDEDDFDLVGYDYDDFEEEGN